MLKVLEREIPVHIHVSAADDIMTAVRLAEEFKFLRLSLGHAEEAYKVADELAKQEVVVVVGPLMITYDDDGRLVNLADFLVKHGVEVNIMTDADVVQEQFLRYQAAVAVKHGMDPAEALKAITINPAKLTGLEKRIGSIEAGQGRGPRRLQRRPVRHPEPDAQGDDRRQGRLRGEMSSAADLQGKERA